MIFVSLIPYWNFEHPGFEKEKKKKAVSGGFSPPENG